MLSDKKNVKIYPYTIPSHRIDQDALHVVQRLQRFGYLAYFVGGCVRDSLLDSSPKDFDLVTSARPRELRQIFRNCRLIGRRFQLAHLHFGPHKILEVATFRKKPHEDVIVEGMIQEDNEFGDAHTDAFRRDFTLNALLYDPVRHQILDYCGGMDDLKQKRLRVIGDPVLRFQEDPIRMLRALKFMSRLNLNMDPDLIKGLKSERLELAKVAPPRLFQELSRMIYSHQNVHAYTILDDFNFLSILLPEIYAHWVQYPHLKHDHQHLFKTLGDNLNEYGSWSDSLSLATLTWPLIDHFVQKYHWYADEFKHVFARLFAPLCMRLGLSYLLLERTSHIVEPLIFAQYESGWTLYPEHVRETWTFYKLIRNSGLSSLSIVKQEEMESLFQKQLKQSHNQDPSTSRHRSKSHSSRKKSLGWKRRNGGENGSNGGGNGGRRGRKGGRHKKTRSL
jgi:poly(A) polymerase